MSLHVLLTLAARTGKLLDSFHQWCCTGHPKVRIIFWTLEPSRRDNIENVNRIHPVFLARVLFGSGAFFSP